MMEEYTEQIEKFLRGQMSQQEEKSFKEEFSTNGQLRSFAIAMALIVKTFCNNSFATAYK